MIEELVGDLFLPGFQAVGAACNVLYSHADTGQTKRPMADYDAGAGRGHHR